MNASSPLPLRSAYGTKSQSIIKRRFRPTIFPQQEKTATGCGERPQPSIARQTNDRKQKKRVKFSVMLHIAQRCNKHRIKQLNHHEHYSASKRVHTSIPAHPGTSRAETRERLKTCRGAPWADCFSTGWTKAPHRGTRAPAIEDDSQRRRELAMPLPDNSAHAAATSGSTGMRPKVLNQPVHWTRRGRVLWVYERYSGHPFIESTWSTLMVL